MKPFSSKESFFRFASVVLNLYLGISVITFLGYLIAPLLDGKLFVGALLVSGSLIGAALIMKLLLKRARRKIRLKGYECFLICLYGVICMFLWFPPIIGILFSIMMIVVHIWTYKKQLSWVEEKDK